jgi:hypothetical protein
LKQTILDTWNHTLEGHLFISSFIEDPKGNATYIPDPNPELCQGVGRQKKKRIKTTWMKPKLVVQWHSAQSATIQDTPTRNALQQCMLAMHLVRQTRMMLPNLRLVEVHLRDVDVDVVAVASCQLGPKLLQVIRPHNNCQFLFSSIYFNNIFSHVVTSNFALNFT